MQCHLCPRAVQARPKPLFWLSCHVPISSETRPVDPPTSTSSKSVVRLSGTVIAGTDRPNWRACSRDTHSSERTTNHFPVSPSPTQDTSPKSSARPTALCRDASEGTADRVASGQSTSQLEKKQPVSSGGSVRSRTKGKHGGRYPQHEGRSSGACLQIVLIRVNMRRMLGNLARISHWVMLVAINPDLGDSSSPVAVFPLRQSAARR